MNVNGMLAAAALVVLSAPCALGDVPAPYTPVQATATSFRCLGRSMRLGPMLLPVQAVAAGRPVLSAPVALVANGGALDGLRGRGRVVSNAGDAAKLEWTGESASFRIVSRLDAECDGLCWYDITLSPKRPVSLNSLRLEVARIGGTARYLHTAAFTWGTLSQGLKEYGGQWSGRFMPYIWLGDERRGLAWCAESDQGWRLSDPSHALRVTTAGDTVRLTATILDHAETISTAITLRFGLQATPVKPVSPAWQAKTRFLHGVTYSVWQPGKDGRAPLDVMREAGVRTVVFHDTWTDFYGKVSTPYGAQLRKLIDECHKRGMKLIVYVGYGLARSAPEMQGHHDAWSVIPLMPWETTDHGEFRNFDATCPRSGWADWLVSGIDKLFTDYELDGLYFDGTSEAWSCENESHGCGWRDDQGKLHPTYAVMATRRLMRRIAETVHRHRPGAILDVHMSGSLTMPTLSFCDSYWDGEQFEGHTAGEKFELPLHAFRTEFMSYAHGLNCEFLCYRDRPFTFSEAIALAWLHNVEVRPLSIDDLRYVGPIWRAMDAFSAVQAKWLPYWEGSGADAGDPSVQASAFLRNGRAMLFVSHLARKPLNASLHLDRHRLGLGTGPLAARDALTGAAMPLSGDAVPIEFDGMTYRLVEVKREMSEAPMR